MENKKRKIIPALLAAVTLFTACEGVVPTENSVPAATIDEVEFWSAYSTEKVLQDNVNIYDGIKRKAALSVAAVRGEEEATQLIMTTGDKAVKAYDVNVSDFSDGNGNTFAKENVKVYHERYLSVTGPSEYYIEPGYYPDCLVPFEKVKEVGETGFSANSNQGLYVSFDIPETQAAGVYTGALEIIIGDGKKTVPITLKVVDATIGKETHTQSIFLNEWYFYRGELDETEEMYDAYNKLLFDYRLGCNFVTLADMDVEYYAEKVCEYAKIPECPAYNIPHYLKNMSGSGYYLNGRELTNTRAYDPDKLQKYFRVIAYKGLEENVDPFKKAVIYGYDEPELNIGFEAAQIAVKEWSYIVKQCKNIVIDELISDCNIENQELLSQIVESLKNVPHVITQCTYLDNGIDLETDDLVYTPEFQFLETESLRDMYRLSEDNQLWWYGCTAPEYPYPTYHIDDTLLSARLLSWMQADYDIQGNLYWGTNVYGETVDNKLHIPEDYYSFSAAARNPSSYGEGFLLYPGAKYGVYGPLPSVRLEQIRDGLEEYEMIYELKKVYAEISQATSTSYNENAIMNYLYDNLYNGTKVSTTDANFQVQRELLLQMLALAQSDARVCVTDVTEGKGRYQFEIYAETAELKQAGQVISEKTACGNGYLYTLDLELGDGKKLDLSIETGGRSYAFEMDFGNSAIGYDAQYVYDNGVIQKRQISVSTGEPVLATTVNPAASADEKYLQLLLGEAVGVEQDFLLVDDNVIRKLSAADKKFVVRLYNASDVEIKVQLKIKYDNGSKGYSSYSSLELKPGENSLVISGLDSFRWQKLKEIESIRIVIGEPDDAARDCIYFMDMSVYR